MDVISELCDVVTVLDGGRVIAEGSAEDVKRNPGVIEAYLGTANKIAAVGVQELSANPG